MSQPIVVVANPEPEPEPSADFAAGAATVVAAAAADVATDAANAADVARDQANFAVGESIDAAADAAAAHDRIDRLEGLIEELVDVLNEELPAADLPEVDDGAPPPVDTPVEEPEDVAPAPKPRRARSGRWGSDGWFGSRE